ncbi:MAG: ABC transporter ATP-binding protein [Halothiobacillus sp.]
MLFEVQNVATRFSAPISFSLDAGEVLTVFGASGSGKSQMLRALADLSPHEGAVFLEGINQATLRPEQWRRKVGYVPAESGWWADLVGAHFHTRPPADWLAALSLPPELLDAPVERLSSGERQRLAVLRALTIEPRVLLLDEPTANLDDLNAQALTALVLNYVQSHQAAAVWVSHNRDERSRLGARSIEMPSGSTPLPAQGTPA